MPECFIGFYRTNTFRGHLSLSVTSRDSAKEVGGEANSSPTQRKISLELTLPLSHFLSPFKCHVGVRLLMCLGIKRMRVLSRKGSVDGTASA